MNASSSLTHYFVSSRWSITFFTGDLALLFKVISGTLIYLFMNDNSSTDQNISYKHYRLIYHKNLDVIIINDLSQTAVT